MSDIISYRYVYKIVNLINGKVYYGQRYCKCLPEKDRYLGSGKILKQAIKKEGKKNFKKEILEICSTQEEVNKREIQWIAFAKNWLKEDLYNISWGGIGGQAGRKQSKEEKEKRSNNLRGKPGHKWTEEEKKNRSLEYTGRKLSEETKRKCSQNNARYWKGIPMSEDRKRNLSIKNKGKKLSEETKRKISNTLKGNIPWNKGKKYSCFKLKGRKQTRQHVHNSVLGHLSKRYPKNVLDRIDWDIYDSFTGTAMQKRYRRQKYIDSLI